MSSSPRQSARPSVVWLRRCRTTPRDPPPCGCSYAVASAVGTPRAGLGVAAAAGAVSAGIVITNHRAAGPARVVVAATQPSDATTSTEPATTQRAAVDCDAVKAAAASNDVATSQPAEGSVKMHGKITAVADATISVHGDPGGSLADITAWLRRPTRSSSTRGRSPRRDPR